MNALQKTILSALLGLGSLLAFVPRADAGGFVLQALKPDLRIVQVGPHPSLSKAVRFIVANQGTLPSPACYVRVRIKTAAPVVAYQQIPPMSPGAVYDFDVWMGYSPLAKPGLVTEAVADAFSAVSELSESNNLATFVAPN